MAALAVVATLAAPGPSRAQQMQPVPPDAFPQWADQQIHDCVQKSSLKAAECWPGFSWDKAVAAPRYASRFSQKDIQRDIREFLTVDCSLYLHARAAASPRPEYQAKGDAARVASLKERSKALQAVLIRKSDEMGWPKPDLSAALSWAMGVYRPTLDGEQYAGQTACPERNEALMGVLSTFDAVLGSYEEYRKYRIIAYATDTRRFLPVVERSYLKDPGFGFMTVLGRNPAAGRVCFLKTSGWDPQVVARGLVDPKDLPPTVQALPSWPRTLSATDSYDVIPDDSLERGFLGVPESKGHDPTYNADCNVLVGPKRRLLDIKQRVEQRNGIGIVLFPEFISKDAYDRASVAYQASPKVAEDTTYLAEDARLRANYRMAYEYHRARGNLTCMTATDTVARNAERRGGGTAQWLSEQSMVPNAADCVQNAVQRK